MGRRRWPEIKRADVDKAYQRTGNAAQVAEEEILAAKLSLLDDLILQDILIAKAGPLKVEVPDERAGQGVRRRQEKHS